MYAGVGNIDDNSMYTISKTVSERFVLMYNAEHNTNFFLLGFSMYMDPIQIKILES